MRVEAKKRRDRHESLFVFEFESQDEADFFFNGLTTYSEIGPFLKDDKKEIADIAQTLRSRCDGKYGTSEFPLSSALFADEASSALLTCLWSMAFLGELLKDKKKEPASEAET